QSEAAAQHGLVALIEAPGVAQSRTEVVLVSTDQRVRQTCLIGRQRAAERDEAGRQERSDLRIRHDMVAAIDRQKVRERPGVLVPCADDLVTQTEKERQAPVDAPVVLTEQG